MANGSSLTVDTHSVAATPATSPNSALTPASLLSPSRSSYTSSRTGSSDSHREIAYATPQQDHKLHQHKSVDALSSSKKKGDNQRQALSQSQNGKARTAHPSQSNFALPHSKPNVVLSPKTMGATATRFLRRVASAPNAKGLFSSSRNGSSSSKNGMLVPGVTAPPLPKSSQSQQTSLETISSTTEESRSTRQGRATSTSNSKNRTLTADNPAKQAFRRTYSSNSIKVRDVR